MSKHMGLCVHIMRPAPSHTKQRVSMFRNATITDYIPTHGTLRCIKQTAKTQLKYNRQLLLLSLQQSAKTCSVNTQPAPFDEEMKETIRTTASNLQCCYKGS